MLSYFFCLVKTEFAIQIISTSNYVEKNEFERIHLNFFEYKK